MQTRTTGTAKRSPSEPVKLLLDPKSGCWLSTECSLQTQTRRVSAASQQTLPGGPSSPPLLPTLAFTSSCFKISFTPKVQLSSSSHTFTPSSGAPRTVQTFLTHLPETIRSISVPVVLGGSCSSSVGVESAALLCCAKTSVPTRLCIALIFFFFFFGWTEGGRASEGAFRYIVQMAAVTDEDMSAPLVVFCFFLLLEIKQFINYGTYQNLL